MEQEKLFNTGDKYTIIVDVMEPDKIKNGISKLYDSVKIEKLNIGDILCPEKSICIERKSYGDLVGSIKKGHLQKQLLQMQENFQNNYLLISGTPQELHFKNIKWTSNQNTGTMASLAVRYPNVKMVWLPNDKQLCDTAVKIFEKSNDGREITIVDTELMRHNLTTDNIHLKMLCSIPNIGLKQAQIILDKYSIHDLFSVEIEDLCTLDGIGQKKAELIKKYFTVSN